MEHNEKIMGPAELYFKIWNSRLPDSMDYEAEILGKLGLPLTFGAALAYEMFWHTIQRPDAPRVTQIINAMGRYAEAIGAGNGSDDIRDMPNELLRFLADMEPDEDEQSPEDFAKKLSQMKPGERMTMTIKR